MAFSRPHRKTMSMTILALSADTFWYQFRHKASCSGMTFCRMSAWCYRLIIHTFLSRPAWLVYEQGRARWRERWCVLSNVVWWGDAQLCNTLSVTRLSGKCCGLLEPDYERGKLAALPQHRTGEIGWWGYLGRSSWCRAGSLGWSSVSAVS